MTVDPRLPFRSALEAHSNVTLATAGGGEPSGRPWAATVFYASDERLALYFVTDLRTRHGRDLAANARVAGTVGPHVTRWDQVFGLQMEGTAQVLDGSSRKAALQVYLRKFPDVRRMFEAPAGDSERMIAARLRDTPLWRFQPEWLRLIDNSRGFGWKQELTL